MLLCENGLFGLARAREGPRSTGRGRLKAVRAGGCVWLTAAVSWAPRFQHLFSWLPVLTWSPRPPGGSSLSPHAPLSGCQDSRVGHGPPPPTCPSSPGGGLRLSHPTSSQDVSGQKPQGPPPGPEGTCTPTSSWQPTPCPPCPWGHTMSSETPAFIPHFQPCPSPASPSQVHRLSLLPLGSCSTLDVHPARRPTRHLHSVFPQLPEGSSQCTHRPHGFSLKPSNTLLRTLSRGSTLLSGHAPLPDRVGLPAISLTPCQRPSQVPSMDAPTLASAPLCLSSGCSPHPHVSSGGAGSSCALRAGQTPSASPSVSTCTIDVSVSFRACVLPVPVSVSVPTCTSLLSPSLWRATPWPVSPGWLPVLAPRPFPEEGLGSLQVGTAVPHRRERWSARGQGVAGATWTPEDQH